jgi:hypothetical protein
MRLMPETCAFVETHGIKAESLSWPWGSAGGWRFQRGDGVWVAHMMDPNNYYVWYQWSGSAWVRFYPTYTRS